MAQPKKKIGRILVEAGAVTREQVHEALELQQERGGKICQLLIDLGYLTEEAMLAALGSQPGVTSVDLEQYTINADLCAHVPKDYALRHEIMPLDKLGNNLTVAMAVPMDAATRAELEELTGLRIRAVLCGRGTVHRTIEHYYGGGEGPPAAAEPAAAPSAGDTSPGVDAVKLRGALDLIESIEQFPVLLEVHARVMERLDDPEVEIGELTTLIEQDPTLAANVLRVSNSAAYAAQSEFDSLQRAIAYLGLTEVRSIVTGVAILSQLHAEAYFDLSRLFQQCYCRGLLTKIICDQGQLGDYDTAFTAGLLANIGEIALWLRRERAMERLEEDREGSGRAPVDAQEEAFGMSASELGYHLARHWNLPDSLAEVVRFYDRLDRATDPAPLTRTVALAHLCLEREDAEGHFGHPETDPALAALLDTLGLDPAGLPAIQERYYEGLDNATGLQIL